MADGIITTFSCLQDANGLFTLSITIILCALTHVCVTVNKSVLNSSESLNRLNMDLWLAIRNESTKRYIKILISTWTENCCYLCTECHRWLEPNSVPAFYILMTDYANASFRTEESHYSSSRLYFPKERITFIKFKWQNSNIIDRMFHCVPLFLIQREELQWVWYSKCTRRPLSKSLSKFESKLQISTTEISAVLTSDAIMRCHSGLRKSFFIWSLTKISSFKRTFRLTRMALRT